MPYLLYTYILIYYSHVAVQLLVQCYNYFLILSPLLNPIKAKKFRDFYKQILSSKLNFFAFLLYFDRAVEREGHAAKHEITIQKVQFEAQQSLLCFRNTEYSKPIKYLSNRK